ncbi:MAG TPA: cyclic nucleotide-binding domain-containing protein [Paucimonas sp.]|nr:cyclic nucleotide-binding domain-containing protein [Paucimonas sp.]
MVEQQKAMDGFKLMGAGAAFKQTICDMIAGARLFSDLPWADIEALSGYVQCYEVASGTVIFKEGAPGSYMCVLISGEIEILKEDQVGRLRSLVRISRGKTVGEMSIVDGEPRSATCVATQDSVVLLLTKDNYGRIIKERPTLAIHIQSKLAKLMSQRLRCLSGQLVEYLGQDTNACEPPDADAGLETGAPEGDPAT